MLLNALPEPSHVMFNLPKSTNLITMEKDGVEFARHSLFLLNSCLLGIGHFFSNDNPMASVWLVNRVQLPDQRFL